MEFHMEIRKKLHGQFSGTVTIPKDHPSQVWFNLAHWVYLNMTYFG